MDGMPREAIQVLGGRKTPAVMESVYNEVRTEEVVPEMRSAVNGACALLVVRAFVVDLDDDSCVVGEGAVGSDTGRAVRVWFRRFCALKEYLTPSIVLPIRDNFLGVFGRRVRRLELSDIRRRVFL